MGYSQPGNSTVGDVYRLLKKSHTPWDAQPAAGFTGSTDPLVPRPKAGEAVEQGSVTAAGSAAGDM